MFEFISEFDHITSNGMELKIKEKNPGDGVQLPFYYWDVVVDGKTVGDISLRIGQNFHLYYNGNIGYWIDEDERGHGYAASACKMLVPIAKAHGMKSLFLACNEDNIPSYRTIESIGGRLLEICEIPKEYFAWYEGIPKHRIYKWDF